MNNNPYDQTTKRYPATQQRQLPNQQVPVQPYTVQQGTRPMAYDPSFTQQQNPIQQSPKVYKSPTVPYTEPQNIASMSQSNSSSFTQQNFGAMDHTLQQSASQFQYTQANSFQQHRPQFNQNPPQFHVNNQPQFSAKNQNQPQFTANIQNQTQYNQSKPQYNGNNSNTSQAQAQYGQQYISDFQQSAAGQIGMQLGTQALAQAQTTVSQNVTKMNNSRWTNTSTSKHFDTFSMCPIATS